MFRRMRRKRQEMTQEENMSVLTEGTSGVLALHGDGGYPYAVPLSYVCDGSHIYFHCAREGHKVDAVNKSSKASFCVIGQDDIVPEKFTTHFRSVIAFGTVKILEDDSKKRAAIEKLALKYAPEESKDSRSREIEREWKSLCVLDMTIEHLSGKKAIELVTRRG
ncbi:MAG: pyridoxamine 5'-phosphate oxidase family protein [Ruminococcus sp.]